MLNMVRKTTEEFICEARKVHGDKYDYSGVVYINSTTPVSIYCKEHGAFEQRPDNHLYGKGCKKCGRLSSGKTKTKTTNDFIEEATKVHGSFYSYKLVNYTKDNAEVVIICPLHGKFEQLPTHHLKGSGCPCCGGSKKLTREDFIERSKQVHGCFYIYKDVQYITSSSPVIIECPVHGKFKQIPAHHMRGIGCPSCAYEKHPGKYGPWWLNRNHENKEEDCIIYLLMMFNDTEKFLKLGITSKDINKRYPSKSQTGGYKYTMIKRKKTSLESAILTEMKASIDLSKSKYTPKARFGGKTECYKMDAEDKIKALINSCESKGELT